MKIEPCLFFNGDAEEAIAFYASILIGGARIMRSGGVPPSTAAASRQNEDGR